MKRSKQILAAILSIAMLLSFATGCNNNAEPNQPVEPTPAPSEPTPAPAPTPAPEPEVPAEPKIARLPFDTDAGNVSSLIDNSSAASAIVALIAGKLYNTVPVDGKGSLIPILAASEPVDVNGDGLTWNITVSDDAMFENGEKITADTFMYTFKAALDPKLVLAKASTMAKSSHIEIVNANAYYGQAAEGATPVAWEDVGFKKIDDMMFQINLVEVASKEQVMRHFASAVTTPIYQPMFESCLSADGTTTTYGSAADKIVNCGPYTLKEWVIGSVRVFEKNENYIQADKIKLDGLEYIFAEDANTRMQLFKNGEIDSMSLSVSAREEFGDDPRIMFNPQNTVHMVEFNTYNTNKPIVNNENFRKALYHGTNRAELAKILGYEPGVAPIGLRCTPSTDGTTFREMAAAKGYDQLENYGYDPELAKKLFDQALAEEGLTTLDIMLQFKSGDSYFERIAEYLKENWQNLFGTDKFTLTLNGLPSNQNSAQRKAWREDPNCYEMCVSNWALTAASLDALSALQVYTDAYTSRNAPYEYEYLNALYKEGNTGKNRLDKEKRNEIAMMMEEYMIEHAIMVPLIYYGSYTIFSDRVILAVDQADVELGFALAYMDLAQ